MIAQLPPGTPHPRPVGAFWSVIGTPEETSVVCLDEHRPTGAVAQDSGWALLRLGGTFELDLVGVLIQVLAPLAAAGIEIFALSTYNTDYLLIRSHRVDDARHVLVDHGHVFNGC